MKRITILLDPLWQEKYKNSNNEEDTYLSILLHIIKRWTSKYELILLANAYNTEAIVKAREILSPFIAPQQLRLFSTPATNNELSLRIQAYALASLNADSSFLLGYETSQNKATAFLKKITKQPNRVNINTTKKPKLAYFSPLPPERSGISFYSAELLPYLAQHYDITLIVEEIKHTEPYETFDFPLMSSRSFEEKAEEFDRILYHMGNSHYHTYMWKLISAHPGVAVLHDFFLSALLTYEEFINGKNMWSEALFVSHGFPPLDAYINRNLIDEVKFEYPCNYDILQPAHGIITHSDYSAKLANTYYRQIDIQKWKTIPLLRIPVPDLLAKKEAKTALGFQENDKLICSFGILNITKQNHRLLQAFLNSSLSKDTSIHLVFVGENNSGQYALDMAQMIKRSGLKGRIHITGWTDDNTFKTYLQAAELGVQLRSTSRGETSAAVLDCMNHALATIVNANGAMAEIPKELVYMLEDQFEEEVLQNALEELIYDETKRETLGSKAHAYILKHHNPEFCASRYNEAIESFYAQNASYTQLIHDISSHLPSRESEQIELAEAISHSSATKLQQKQILVDVSAIVIEDLGTGIQRVVKTQLLELLKQLPKSWRVEAVYLTYEEGRWVYRYARHYLSALLKLPFSMKENKVVFGYGDILYIPDLSPSSTIAAHAEGLFHKIKAVGTSIETILYDLLPLTHPEFFPPDADVSFLAWLNAVSDFSDRLNCISKATENDFKQWHTTYYKTKSIPKTTVLHLGANFQDKEPLNQTPATEAFLNKVENRPLFLMVGTIEPRKGHLQTLAAFEALWEEGEDVVLVIIGKEGWKGLPDTMKRTIPETISRLRNHPEKDTHLFWFENADDAFLEQLYKNASALIAASECEGFGLPLIEAAWHGLPIIARDIPVFNEVAGENAFYFPSSNEADKMCIALKEWLNAYRKSAVPAPAIPYKSWTENANELIALWMEKE